MIDRKILIWLTLLLFLMGCGFSSSREDAAEIMEMYFAAIEGQDFQAAMAFYAETFFKESSRKSWESKLKGYNRQLGNLESYEAISWKVKKNMGANAGTFVQAVYRTRYSRRPAVEQFILKKADAGFQIIAHRIEAKEVGKGKGKTEYI